MRRKHGRILRVTCYLSYRNELTRRKRFVIIQATPHRLWWVRSWTFLKKYNYVPSLHMYRFIIKATRPAIFLRFAHMYVYNLGLIYVCLAHNQALKTLPQVIFEYIMMFINLLHINHALYLCYNCSFVISIL